MNRQRVYLAGPISQGCIVANVEQATQAFFSLLRLGYAPLCPHWSCFSGEIHTDYPETETPTPHVFPSALPRDTTHADWVGADLPWVRVADAVLRLPGASVGADQEVNEAVKWGVPVFHDIPSLVAALSSPPKRDAG